MDLRIEVIMRTTTVDSHGSVHSPLWFFTGIALGSVVATGSTLLYLKYVQREREQPYRHQQRELQGSGEGPAPHHHRRKSHSNHRKSFGGNRGGAADGHPNGNGHTHGHGHAAGLQPPPMNGAGHATPQSTNSNGRPLERRETAGYYFDSPHGRGGTGNGVSPADSQQTYRLQTGSVQSMTPSPMRYAGNSDAVSESEGGSVVRGGMNKVYTAGPADRSNLGVLTRAAAVSGHGNHHGGVVGGVGVSGGVGGAGGGNTPKGGVVMGVANAASQAGHQHQHAMAHQTTQDVLKNEGSMIEDAALHELYNRVLTPEMPHSEETQDVCHRLKLALDEREKWVFKPRVSPQDMHVQEAHSMKECLLGSGSREQDPFHWDNMGALPLRFHMVDGVVHIFERDARFDDLGGFNGAKGPSEALDASDTNDANRLFAPPGDADEFFGTLHRLLKMSAMGSVRSFTHHRMQLLEQKFNLHVMLNADKEFLAQKSAPHRDFYNVRKVDTHVHHSACMHQKHLLRFIKSKLKKEPDELVIFRDGKFLTLKEVFESLNLTSYDLSVDSLDVHADKNIFHRFDKFNLKYNPFGQARLREIFIKQENIIRGRFLAELTKEVFNDLESSKYQLTEYRISIYGRKQVEWDALAAWVVQNRLYSDNNLWMIQIPRLYNVYKAQGILENFQQFLDNIFLPMFETTINPESHPMLHIFLKHVSGFDLVDDESKPERKPTKHMPTPAEWNIKHNPPYAYYTYYVYANLYSLNKLRESRGLNTFSLRPHCGEAGDLDHLAATFLLAENIAHGINLRKSPCLQYLYYVAQIGLMMSPLSNNSLFLDYHRNPFPQFFARGLSVSLSTDDPLQIHLTREPLVEEYSVAAQVWKLSATDLCEIARNSIIHSGFPHQLKMHWVHTEYWKDGPEGNNIQKTNVPSLRMIFRKDCLHEERGLIRSGWWAAHERKMSSGGTGL